MVGEIGGSAEEEAAEFIRRIRQEAGGVVHPQAPPLRRASAWVTPARSSPVARARTAAKFAALEKAGVTTVKSPADLGKTLPSC